METPKVAITYIREYRNAATKFRDIETCKRWWELDFDLNLAVAFSNRGFLPDEALTLLHWIRTGADLLDEDDYQDLINVLSDSKKLKFEA